MGEGQPADKASSTLAYLFHKSRGLLLLIAAPAVLSCPLWPAHPSLHHWGSAMVTSLFPSENSRDEPRAHGFLFVLDVAVCNMGLSLLLSRVT